MRWNSQFNLLWEWHFGICPTILWWKHNMYTVVEKSSQVSKEKMISTDSPLFFSLYIFLTTFKCHSIAYSFHRHFIRKHDHMVNLLVLHLIYANLLLNSRYILTGVGIREKREIKKKECRWWKSIQSSTVIWHTTTEWHTVITPLLLNEFT